MLGTIAELGAKLADLCDIQANWSQKTFGADSARSPVGALRHLGKEAVEAEKAYVLSAGHPNAKRREDWNGAFVGPPEEHAKVKEEMADCLLLVLDASRRAGIKPMQLLEAALDKMKVNQARDWPAPQDDQPVEHVKE